MKKIFFITTILLSNFYIVYSQGDFRATGEIKNEIPEGNLLSNPDVSALHKVNMFDMNLYTGKANVNIPIYEIKSGDISIPIALNYDTGGVKVDEFSTSVGQNWSLIAGGSISRIIKDFPDNEISYGLFAENDWDLGVILNPELNYIGYNRPNRGVNIAQVDYLKWGPGVGNRYAVYSELIGVLTGTPFNNGVQIDRNDYQRDFCPDLFIASAPSLNTKFTCINNTTYEIYPNNNNFTTNFLDNSGCKMSSYLIDVRSANGFGFGTNGYDHEGRTQKGIKDFFRFEITNDKGLIYNFNDEEIKETFLVSPNLDINYPNNGSSSEQNENIRTMMNNYSKKVHTWNLSTIRDVKNNIVTYQYETYSNNNTLKSKNGGKSVEVGVLSNFLNTCLIGQSEFYQYLTNHLSEKLLQKDIKKKRLSKILFNGGEVNFVYSMDRLDYAGEKALTEINVKNIFGEIVKKVIFNYNYFASKENCTTQDCKRMYLISINEVSSTGQVLSHEFEYDQAEMLPKKGSLEQDYFGFYNNNGLVNANNSQNTFSPKLYFYQNNGKNSLLPFQRTDVSNHVFVNGEIDLVPNNHSLKGLLKRVTYPTGAQLELEYENNSFQFFNQNYTGGGARVKNQKIFDNGTLKRQLNYDYKELDNKSSGYMNNFPVYGNLLTYKTSPFQCYSFAAFDKAKISVELTNGNYIGYSRVTEYEVGKGKTVYSFSSPKEVQNTLEVKVPLPANDILAPGTGLADNVPCMTALINNSAYPSIANIDYDYMRGKLLEMKIYDVNDNILQSELNEYSNRNFSETNLSKTFVLQYGNGLNDGLIYGLNVSSKIRTSDYLLSKTTKKDYFGSQFVTNILDLSYTNLYPFVNKIKNTTSTGISEIYRFYPFDSEVSGLPLMSNLIQQNKLREVIKEKTYNNSELLQSSLVNYNSFENIVNIVNGFSTYPVVFNSYLSKSISTAKGTNPLTEEGIITKRDLNGNILEFKNKNDKYNVILYGYSQTLPIAKIENATYTQIEPYVDNLKTLSNINDQANLLLALNNLRTNLPHAMVTTYTHKPLVGVLTITDPKGDTINYEYDSFGRLSTVKDKNGNIHSENQYNYRTQN